MPIIWENYERFGAVGDGELRSILEQNIDFAGGVEKVTRKLSTIPDYKDIRKEAVKRRLKVAGGNIKRRFKRQPIVRTSFKKEGRKVALEKFKKWASE
jgi:hypothetical protein